MGHSYSQTGNTPHRAEQPPHVRYFPPELLLLVLEAAYCLPSTPCEERRAGLRTASLVSLAWLYPAQQLLWRSVEVRGISQLKALRRTCEVKGRGFELATHARKLSVWNPVGDPVVFSTMHDIARLLKRLPKVEALHLHRPSSHLSIFASFDLQIAVTRRPDIPKLTTLRIAFARPLLAHTLLRILPTLRFVDIRGSLPDNDNNEEDTTRLQLYPDPRCKLYELRWGVNSRLHVTHALGFSPNTLRILALHSLPPAFPALMRTHGSLLRSLRVFRYDPSLPLAIHHCPVLEEFIMQDHVPPPELLAALPLTLEHLAIDCDYGYQRGLEAVAAWVKQRRGRLRVLTCFSPDESDTDWPSFVQACQRSDVELRCFKGWHGPYENEDEELGEVDRFPRTVPYHAQRVLQPALTGAAQS